MLNDFSRLFLLDTHKSHQEKNILKKFKDAIVLNGDNLHFIQNLAFSCNTGIT